MILFNFQCKLIKTLSTPLRNFSGKGGLFCCRDGRPGKKNNRKAITRKARGKPGGATEGKGEARVRELDSRCGSTFNFSSPGCRTMMEIVFDCSAERSARSAPCPRQRSRASLHVAWFSSGSGEGAEWEPAGPVGVKHRFSAALGCLRVRIENRGNNNWEFVSTGTGTASRWWWRFRWSAPRLRLPATESEPISEVVSTRASGPQGSSSARWMKDNCCYFNFVSEGRNARH